MRLFKSVLVFLFVVSIFMVQNVHAETISGRYQLNANNWTGYLDIDLKEKTLKGTFTIIKDRWGKPVNQVSEIVECKVEYDGKITIAITFRRGEQSPQWYYGWFSEDRKLIAGYFEKPGQKKPWFASKID